MNASTISPYDLNQQVVSGQAIDLIDVRTPTEFQEIHVPFARNIPLDRLAPANFGQERIPASQPIYVICRSGSRGRQAQEKLNAAGRPHVINVEGGTLAWDDAGLPVVRGRKVMSLERQVRVAAGSLVVVGVVLGATIHPAFYGLSAFVGAGLVFSGVTDTCGMGLVLARMPWNKVLDRAGSPSGVSE